MVERVRYVGFHTVAFFCYSLRVAADMSSPTENIILVSIPLFAFLI